jgi:hypothetical protein
MVSAEEKRRLVSRLGNDPPNPVAAVLKCLAAILVLIVVAAGPWVFLGAGGRSGPDGERASLQANQAVTESRHVFEERRRLHESARKTDKSAPRNAVSGPRLAVE